MKQSLVMLLFLWIGSHFLWAQQSIDVCEATLKIKPKQEESLFFGFAEGDQIVVQLEEIDHKILSEFEIIALPTSSCYKSLSVDHIYDKRITVNKKSVYQFVLRNNTVLSRSCKIKIQRIPNSKDTKNFNTGWRWEVQRDTVYHPYTQDSLVGYDTLVQKKAAYVSSSSELKEFTLIDKIVTVKPRGIMHTNNARECVPIKLPELNNTNTCRQEIVAWAYWLGVGPSANNFFTRNKSSLVSLSGLVTSNPLAKFAVGLVTTLIIPDGNQVDPIQYGVTNYENRVLFMQGKDYSAMDYGEGKGAFCRFSDPTQCSGTYYLCLHNKNRQRSVEVTVKAVAIVKVETYKEKEHEKMKVTPRYTTITKYKPEVRCTKIRVNAE